ncbi:damage-binding protein 1 [Seminavis robusta]|uniref:Damage-binding protein 1 n=1 Tax=Seminavis robusta TaxID=568900 RepID=A0A9N8DQ20_9STRA|nr:damage-binding protein 1 [Seminavis robusta]|eukprot:Sro204_g085800.1 damage-binding protein 1 (1035) ;mRNA; r:17556-20729
MPGIQAMWSVRENYASPQDAYLVQSFVGQTRVLGVTTLTDDDSQQDEPQDKTMEESGDDDDDEEAGGTLEEVELQGLDANATSLYVGNVQPGDGLLQITEAEIRLISLPNKEGGSVGEVLDTWTPPGSAGMITVAAGNEAGQAVVATPGGTLWYLAVNEDGTKLESLHQKQMDREVSCLDVHPFAGGNNSDTMDASSSDQPRQRLPPKKSSIVAVGLWDDFTVRLLALNNDLQELHQIHLSTDDEEEEEEDPSAMMSAEESAMARRHRNNMMARSLCLITLDVSSSSSSHHHGGGGGHSSSLGNAQGVDMLFVGLGDGTVVSFAVVVMAENERVSVQSKKEVCLGTQRINLIPLQTEWGGTCVLATGDRPTVIYLAGVGSGATPGGGSTGATASFNPKLCYSNVNLQVSDDEEAENVSRSASQQTIAVNVAAPFFSSLLFDAGSLGSQYYSLCVADDANLRLGVIDDIQKLHVTTCRLGMAPRRIVHCPDARMFAVGCIESGIKQLGLGGEEHNMGNCVRFLDDTTFDDIERFDLEPYEMILSMTYASLRVHSPTSSASTATDTEGGVNSGDPTGDGSGASNFRTYLLIGTAYALPDEDEPTRGRIMVMSCGGSGMEEEAATSNNARAIRQVTELQVRGAVYSMSQFYDGKVLAAVNSKTQILQLTDDVNAGGMKLNFVGVGHHGHILSLFVKSQAGRQASLAASPASGEEQKGPAAVASVPMDVDNPHKKKKPAPASEQEMLAIVGDLMRSISVVQYYPQHDTLEEIARDFNTNWTTAIEMLNDDVYLGAENWNNLFVLRRNTKSQSEEIRCRLDTIGEFHLGEMVNKFMKGSLVMPHSSNSAANTRKSTRRGSVTSPTKKKTADGTSPSKGGQGAAVRIRRPPVVIGSQTLFGTVEGTLGCILGLDVRTAAFFSCIERAMTKVIRPIGDFGHQKFRAFDAERRIHPHHGFVDGDLVESFLDLDRTTMDAVVKEMNRDGGWEVDRGTMSPSSGREGGSGGDKGDANPDVDPVDHPELVVEDVVAMVEEMAMLH